MLPRLPSPAPLLTKAGFGAHLSALPAPVLIVVLCTVPGLLACLLPSLNVKAEASHSSLISQCQAQHQADGG